MSFSYGSVSAHDHGNCELCNEIDTRIERLLELLERAKLYVERVEVQPSFGSGSRHLESAAAKDLRIAIDDEVAPPSDRKDRT